MLTGEDRATQLYRHDNHEIFFRQVFQLFLQLK